MLIWMCLPIVRGAHRSTHEECAQVWGLPFCLLESLENGWFWAITSSGERMIYRLRKELPLCHYAHSMAQRSHFVTPSLIANTHCVCVYIFVLFCFELLLILLEIQAIKQRPQWLQLWGYTQVNAFSVRFCPYSLLKWQFILHAFTATHPVTGVCPTRSYYLPCMLLLALKRHFER